MSSDRADMMLLDLIQTSDAGVLLDSWRREGGFVDNRGGLQHSA